MKPFKPSSLRAVDTALDQATKWELLFLAAADAALDTTLPRLFLVSLSLVRPPLVFDLVPRNTEDLARLPLAICDFMAFFMAFFMATFMATFFMERIGKAMATARQVVR